jgi:hypothetical protein
MSTNVVATGRRLIELTKRCHLANVPLLLIGGHGLGKSELLAQAAKEFGIDCVTFDLSIMEPTDLVGLPREREGQTIYSPPASLPTKGKGILVFEELNRAPQCMRAPCLQLLTGRRLNSYELPSGWLPVAAINPPDADAAYEVSELDPALLSRFVQVVVKVDRKQWLAWGRENGIHEDVLNYIAADPMVFDSPKSNPRAWTYVSSFLSTQSGNGVGGSCARLSPATLRTVVAGLVGAKRAASFFKFLRTGERPFTAEDVLDDYAAHREQVLGWVAAGRLDPVKATLLNVMTRLQAKLHYAEVQKDTKSWGNLGQFLTGDLR